MARRSPWHRRRRRKLRHLCRTLASLSPQARAFALILLQAR